MMTGRRGAVEDARVFDNEAYSRAPKDGLDPVDSPLDDSSPAIFSPPTTEAVSSRLNRMSTVESQLALLRSTVEGLGAMPSSEFGAEMRSVQAELARLKELESVPGQLKQVECRLDELERIWSADRAELATVTDKVETMALALDVVEQSLEYFEDNDETLDNLRSRADDFDQHMGKVELKLDELRKTAEEARALALAANKSVDDLKEGVSLSLVSSGASTPSGASVAERSSNARVKAAVHTLSDGYRSLHRAMNLMYDEQTDMATRVAAVGRCAQRDVAAPTMAQKIAASAAGILSFPLQDLGDDSDGEAEARVVEARVVEARVVEARVVEASVLAQAQARELARNDARVAQLEAEVRMLKSVLGKLIEGDAEGEGEGEDEDEDTAPPVKLQLDVSDAGRIVCRFS